MNRCSNCKKEMDKPFSTEWGVKNGLKGFFITLCEDCSKSLTEEEKDRLKEEFMKSVKQEF